MAPASFTRNFTRNEHPRGWALSARHFRFWLTDYRRTWRGSIYSSVLSPVLFLGALGLGLGSLIGSRHAASLGGVPYLVFLAPGLLAAAAMASAVDECSYPVYGSVKWNRTCQAAVSTPLRPADVFAGHLLFVTMRLAMNSVIFVAVAAAMGAVRSAWIRAVWAAAAISVKTAQSMRRC